MTKSFYSNGKLLLTAEYGVLDGALALAIPTKYGQSLEIRPSDSDGLSWESLDADGQIWFKGTFELGTFKIIASSDKKIAQKLVQLLKWAKKLNPEFQVLAEGVKVTTKLTFPRNWGLGSSSTLINNMAQWADINPFELLNRTFGGSGYDIACAQHDTPILFQLKERQPSVEKISFNPSFKDKLYFIYLNRKQNSREAIVNYRKRNFDSNELAQELSKLTQYVLEAQTIPEIESLFAEHEELLSTVLKIQPIKERLFADYFGAIKSLGGWGGDFILATGNEKTPDYFKAKGFEVVIPYGDMVLKHP